MEGVNEAFSVLQNASSNLWHVLKTKLFGVSFFCEGREESNKDVVFYVRINFSSY